MTAKEKAEVDARVSTETFYRFLRNTLEDRERTREAREGTKKGARSGRIGALEFWVSWVF